MLSLGVQPTVTEHCLLAPWPSSNPADCTNQSSSQTPKRQHILLMRTFSAEELTPPKLHKTRTPGGCRSINSHVWLSLFPTASSFRACKSRNNMGESSWPKNSRDQESSKSRRLERMSLAQWDVHYKVCQLRMFCFRAFRHLKI